MAKKSAALLPGERIERSILLIREQKVLLDFDLAALYEVETRTLVQAVNRNAKRFPDDFMFQLSAEELDDWRSQFVTSNPGAKRVYDDRPMEQGVAMLSSVLRSDRAVAVNIEIMWTFVRLREILATHVELARKLAALEQKYDKQFSVVFDAIRQLMTPVQPDRAEIGYHTLVSQTNR